MDKLPGLWSIPSWGVMSVMQELNGTHVGCGMVCADLAEKV